MKLSNQTSIAGHQKVNQHLHHIMTNDNNKSSNSSEENHVEKQAIDQTNFGRFKFYKRVRLEEYQVQVTAQQNITDYPGLLVVSKENAIRYKKMSQAFSTNTNWERVLQKSIELTLLDLIIRGVVELSIFIDKKSYFGGLVKREYIGFYLTASKVYSGKDYLLHRQIRESY